MKLIVLLALVGLAFSDCPAWRPWRPQSECLWLRNAQGKVSGREMMQGFIDSCGITMDGKSVTDLPDIPIQIDFPEKCGHCSFKIECRNRDGMDDGCFPIDTKKHVCSEFSDVCMMPQVPQVGGCRWAAMGAIWAQCTTTRNDIPEWQRQGFKEGSKFFPQQNCIKKDDGCACCCHPYRPVDVDGTLQCQAVREEPECPDYGEWNEWTDCLWWPPKELMNTVANHCWGKEMKVPKKSMDFKKFMPKDFEVPDKCGFCSFRLRCKKRDTGGKPGCFPVEADKKVCGADDCEGCDQPCTLPQLPEAQQGQGIGPCDLNKKLMKLLELQGKVYLKKFKSYWKKRGIMKMAQYIPLGKCVSVGDQCKCCCHPYEPSADGSTCQLKDMCKLPQDMGFTWGVTNE